MPDNLISLLIMDGALGGLGAWLIAKAVASSWRPWSLAMMYALLLGSFLHFLHYALFKQPFAHLGHWTAHTAILLSMTGLAYRYHYGRMLARQYPWEIKVTGLFSWEKTTNISK